LLESPVNVDERQRWISQAVAEHERRLLRYAHHLLGDEQAAADAVQDAFCRLCREDPGRLNGHLAQWLYTVVRHRAMDQLRKERPMSGQTSVILESRSDGAAGPAQRVEEGESGGRALEAIGRLPRAQQEVVRLRFQQGLSYKQIAAVTGHTATNVGFLLHTAIKTLRQTLNVEPPATARSRSQEP
jgi:RNA polymerase sigma-70 factor (ECF subfamily)